jgi:hypothetical protein
MDAVLLRLIATELSRLTRYDVARIVAMARLTMTSIMAIPRRW